MKSITTAVIKEINVLYNTGLSMEKVGEKLGITSTTVGKYVEKTRGFRPKDKKNDTVKHYETNENLDNIGRSNKKVIAKIRGGILLNKYINLQINKNTEVCEVVFKTFNFFTVKRKNYIESFNFTDVMLGNIKVLGMQQ